MLFHISKIMYWYLCS